MQLNELFITLTRIFLAVPGIIGIRMMRIVTVLEPTFVFSVVFLDYNYSRTAGGCCDEAQKAHEENQLFHRRPVLKM